MIISRKQNEDSVSLNDNEQQQTLSTLDLGAYRKTHQKIKKASGKKIETIQWKRYLIIAAICLGIAMIIYVLTSRCIDTSSPLLEHQRHKVAQLQSQLKYQEAEIKENIKRKAELETKIADLTERIVNSQIKESSTSSSQGNPSSNSDPKNPNAVIDITYASKQYSRLPINPLKRNSENKRIEDVMYKDEATRKKRVQFAEQRISFVNSKSNYPNLFLTKYNLILTEQYIKKGIEQNQKDWKRLEQKFKLSSVKQQLPMCIVVPGYNNNANFRIQSNLNSIFAQNYTNYKAVIINDASSDGGGEVYRKYFDFHSIDKKRYDYVENSKRVTALQNIYLVSIYQCSKDSIVVTLDADDEFIGRNVLQVLNWAYQTKKSGVLYSNFYWFQQPQTLMYGFTSQYTDNEKNNNLYRGSPMKFSHLRSYRTELIHQINPKDLQDEKGVFFTIAYDMALFFPLMELSCGRVNKIEGEFHYLYNVGTGLNDYQDRGRQVAVDNRVRGQKKYECFKQFNEKMNK